LFESFLKRLELLSEHLDFRFGLLSTLQRCLSHSLCSSSSVVGGRLQSQCG
jgi:hypothetical protein